MPIPQAMMDRIDAFLALAFTQLTTLQNGYYAGLETVRPAGVDQNGKPTPAITRTRSRYWQGLRSTGSATPADGAKLAPDPTLKPSYQPESWADLGVTLPATMEVALRVDQYQSRAGDGWVATVEVLVAGRLWRRSQGRGPESVQRNLPWTDVTPDAALGAR